MLLRSYQSQACPNSIFFLVNLPVHLVSHLFPLADSVSESYLASAPLALLDLLELMLPGWEPSSFSEV